MKKLRDLQLKRDLVKLLFLAVTAVGVSAIFVVNPALSTPMVLSMVVSMLLSPWVAMLERRGIPRWASITLVFSVIGLFFGGLGLWISQSFQQEWDSFKTQAPRNFNAAIDALRGMESSLKAKYAFLASSHPTDSLLGWGQETGRWFVENGAALAGSILTWILIIPILTFVLLNDGRSMRGRMFQLVPNRWFEAVFLVSNEITIAISDYLRAKLLEAFLVGALVTIGLFVVDAPYAIVLGIAAGLTNIVPYLGPLLGAAPAILIAGFDAGHPGLLWSVVMVYVIANAIDTLVIFPVVVAKLVNLHPLLLIAVVAIGQQYYGLVGMLLSIPVATACKVIIAQIYTAIYEQRVPYRPNDDDQDAEEPLVHVEL